MYIPIDALILFQTTPAGIVAEPQKVAIFIGYLSRDADLVAVEVVGLLAAFIVCGCPIADFRQGVVAVVFVAVPQSVGRGDLVKVVLKTETACIPHTPYVRIKDFVRTTAC